MTQWTLQPILHPWVLLGIAVVLVGALLIRPAFQTATARRVFWLRLMRFGMIGFLMLAMLRPGCVKTVEKQQAAVLVMLCDISRSMQLAHRSETESRYEALSKMLREFGQTQSAQSLRQFGRHPRWRPWQCAHRADSSDGRTERRARLRHESTGQPAGDE